jgi:hypothetical protein
MLVSSLLPSGDARQASFVFLTAVLAAVLAVGGLFPSSAAAQDETVVSIRGQEASSGAAVDVPVEVTGFNQIGSVSLIVTYDPDALSFPGEDEDAESEDLISNAVRSGFTANVSTPGELRISWFAGVGADPINLGEGTLLEITFSEFAGTTTEVAFGPNSEIADADANPVGATFEDGTVAFSPNQAPEVQGTIPDNTITTPGPPLQLIGVVQTVFQDPDGDELSVSATSGDPSVVTAAVIDGRNVRIAPEGTGTAEVTLTASDGQAEASLSFMTTVEQRAAGDPEPSARAVAAVSSAGNGQVLDFGDTGVKLVPAAVEGSGNVSVEFFDDGPDGPDGISEENVSQYRAVITAADELGFGSDTEVRFPVSDFRGIDDPTQVTIYSRSSPGNGSFSALPTSVDDNGTPSDPSDDEIVGTTESFSEFVLASGSEPLPVELVRFTARLDGAAATLRWETASETNNAGFAVQHQGPDQQGFGELGFVESRATSGTTEEPETYRFRTEDLAPGTHQFRLRQVDLDGSETLLKTASVEVQASRELALEGIGANPVEESTRFAFSVKQGGQATVALYNALGQQVRTLRTEAARVGQRYTVDVTTSDLASGVYFVTLEAPSGTQTERIEVVR